MLRNSGAHLENFPRSAVENTKVARHRQKVEQLGNGVVNLPKDERAKFTLAVVGPAVMRQLNGLMRSCRSMGTRMGTDCQIGMPRTQVARKSSFRRRERLWPPDSVPELRGPFKRLSLFRHFMQLTRQVQIRSAGIGVSCYASGALISERPFLKRFCAEVHEVTTSRPPSTPTGGLKV